MAEAARVRAAVEAEPWLVTEAALETIRLVAERAHDPAAVSRYAGANAERELVARVGATAVLNLTGPMVRYAGMFDDVSGLTSTETIAARFAELDADADVQRIILQMDTPGGMANGIAEAGELIRGASTPTVAYITGQCCSAGYWLASQCDRIIVGATSITGCIGVRARAPGEPGNDELVSRYAPAKLGSRAASQAVVDRLEDEFLAAVARGRGVTVAHVVAHYGQGAVFVGADAVAAGLADAVGTLDTVLGEIPTARTARPTDAEESPVHRRPTDRPDAPPPAEDDTEEELDQAARTAEITGGARAALELPAAETSDEAHDGTDAADGGDAERRRAQIAQGARAARGASS